MQLGTQELQGWYLAAPRTVLFRGNNRAPATQHEKRMCRLRIVLQTPRRPYESYCVQRESELVLNP